MHMEELHKRDFDELFKYGHVVNHPEPNILECEVKWPSSRSDGIPVELLE